jgi:hypothetical protein
MILVTTEIQEMGESKFMGWTHEFKALVVQGSSINEVKKEMLISLRAKIAFDLKLPIHKINGEEVTDAILNKAFKGVSDNTFETELLA